MTLLKIVKGTDENLAENNEVGRKSRDFFKDPRPTFPVNLRRARFYNDLIGTDEQDDDDDDIELDDETNRFERDTSQQERPSEDDLYEDMVKRALNDDLTDLGVLFDGAERVEKLRRKFTRDTDPKRSPLNLDTMKKPKKKPPRKETKAEKLKRLKAGQKEGERELEVVKNDIKRKEDFMFMFNRHPVTGIRWEEPVMLPHCWTQAMLAQTHHYFSPSCNMDGTFSPKQCFLERCWCVKPDGKPVEAVEQLRFKYKVNGMIMKCKEQLPRNTTKPLTQG